MTAQPHNNNNQEQDSLAPLPTPPEALLRYLDDLNIAYLTHHHPAVFTVSDSLEFERNIPGMHCRNLFVRDKRESMFLISAENDTVIDLKAVENILECKRLSFGSAERLWAHLGVRPGSVCPYGLINDTKQSVRAVLDARILDAEWVNFHPLINTMTIGVAPQDLIRFIESTGRTPLLVDFNRLQPISLS
jgi:Ala-tRNA(Pro) deacylase